MQGLARLLSVLGHPVLLMPLAVALSVRSRGGDAGMLAAALGLTAVVAVAVVAYSALQVRRGRWRHVDATVPAERRQLNLFALAVLAACALAGAAVARPVGLGLAAGVALVGTGLLLRRHLHLSLHAGFGALAVALAWPQVLPMALLALLVAGVCWSRLVLGRHRPLDVAAGLAAGALAGGMFVAWV